ncbi:MAG: hypothetical protein WCT36_05100, partial [Candidatus Gracilibacteria bacterium]
SIGVPSDDQALLESNILKLTKDQQRVLVILSVLGPASLELVNTVFKSSDKDKKALLDLEREDIVQVSPFVDFTHPARGEVARRMFGDLVPDCAKSLIVVFEAFIDAGRFHSECTSFKLYELAKKAGDKEIQLKYAIAAGNEALSRYDNDGAIEIFYFVLGESRVSTDTKRRFDALNGLGRANMQKGECGVASKHLSDAGKLVDPENIDSFLELSSLTRDALYMSGKEGDITTFEFECARVLHELELKCDEIDPARYEVELAKIDFDKARFEYLKMLSPNKYKVKPDDVRKTWEAFKVKLESHKEYDPTGKMLKEANRFIGLTYYYGNRDVDSDVLAFGMEDKFRRNYCEAIAYFDEFTLQWRQSPTGINPKAAVSAMVCDGYAKALVGDEGFVGCFQEATDTAIKYCDYKQAAYAFMMWGGAETILYHRGGGVDENLLKSASSHFHLAEREAGLLKQPPFKFELAFNRAQMQYFAGLHDSDVDELNHAVEILSDYDGSDANIAILVSLIKRAGKSDVKIPSKLINGKGIASAIDYVHDQYSDPMTVDGISVVGEKLQSLYEMLVNCDDVKFLSQMFDDIVAEIGHMNASSGNDALRRYYRHFIPTLSVLSVLIEDKSKGAIKKKMPFSNDEFSISSNAISGLRSRPNFSVESSKTADLKSAFDREISAVRHFII